MNSTVRKGIPATLLLAPHLPDRQRSGPPIAAAFLLLACIATATSGQTTQPTTAPAEINQDYLREHYTKFEYLVPMRDGVRLLTAVYAPKDDAQPYPILLTRTPY